MSGKIHSVWEAVDGRLRKLLNPDTYDRWIAGIVPLELTDTSCRLGVSNDMFCEWLSNHYRDTIGQTLREVTGHSYIVLFEGGHLSKVVAGKQPPGTVAAKSGDAHEEESPATSIRYNSRFTFDTFVIGENNKFSHAACCAVAKTPGMAYNPLFIYGGTGLGKSHLLQAIAQDLLKRKRRAKIEYLTSEEFANRYVDAVSTNTLPHFRNYFRSVDLLLIDDVQFFTGKEKFQEEFFHTFNALHNSVSYTHLTLPTNREV